jgi:hypothetical protein
MSSRLIVIPLDEANIDKAYDNEIITNKNNGHVMLKNGAGETVSATYKNEADNRDTRLRNYMGV